MTDDFVGNFNIKDKGDRSLEIPNIFTSNDFMAEIKHSYESGDDLGLSWGMKPFENKFTWRAGDVNVFSGYMSEGKSQFLLYSAIMASFVHGWRWLVHSPENLPEHVFWLDLIHTVLGISLDIRNPSRPAIADIMKASDWISKHFLLIENGGGYSLSNLLESAKLVHGERKIDGLIIDPWNQLLHSQEVSEREDLYISRQMSSIKSFAKQTDICVNIVAHQVTVRIDKATGNYTKPNAMSISGGAMFSNKADNCITVWRPNRYSDPKDPLVLVNFDKIKKRKLTGVGGEVQIYFDLKINRYFWMENGEHSIGEVVTGLENLTL